MQAVVTSLTEELEATQHVLDEQEKSVIRLTNAVQNQQNTSLNLSGLEDTDRVKSLVKEQLELETQLAQMKRDEQASQTAKL